MNDPSSAAKNSATGETLRASIVRITFQNEDNGYAVVKADPVDPVAASRRVKGGLIALVGPMPGVQAGQSVEAGGEWKEDPKYGPQFAVKWFKPALPSGAAGIQAYLSSGAVKGVGPVMAERIVAAFGEAAFDVLDNDIDQLKNVPGVGPKSFERMRESWKQSTGDRELVTFLGDHGVSPAIAARLRKAYDNAALSIVRNNPYQLVADIRGIGFHRADAIAKKLGLPHDAPERIDAGLIHALNSGSEDGHTCLPRPQLEEEAVKLLEVTPGAVAERLDLLLHSRKFAIEPDGETALIFLPILHDAETRIAAAIGRMISSARRTPRLDAVAALADFEQTGRIELAPEQRQATLTAAREGLTILTGGPGTGKTTTVRAILAIYRAAGMTVKLAAPTGRAARRLGETTKMPAETIHRLLAFNHASGGFTRDASNPIEADLVVVDEISMLDAPLAACLFEALRPGACLLLVGDEDQLPSVGPGAVLANLIESGLLPVVRLREIFRQAGRSMIVLNAHRINQGMAPLDKPPEPGAEPDYFFIARDDPAQAVEAVCTMLAERIPRKFRLDPFRDIQVLAPMRRGELGVEALNAAIKERLNPIRAGAEKPIEQWTPGDRVMQTENDYDKQIFNGDIGRVARVNVDSGELTVDFEGREVVYLNDERDSLVMAYAITIHKSQGSEYPAVVIPLHTQHWVMLQRNLLYTAVTRARKLVCIVGSHKALRRAVANATRAGRFTGLTLFLAQAGKLD